MVYLNAMRFGHLTVNHQEHYLFPVTGAHTQPIERSRLDVKTRILKETRGVRNELFQSHLDHICWKVLRKNIADLFVPVLNDVRSVSC